jgi:hypothetical protein
MVHPGEHARHPELLLGQQRRHEVVLVVAGDRHEHVSGLRRRGRELRHLAGVGDDPLDGVEIIELAQQIDALVRPLHDHHLVACRGEVAGDERADLARSDDHDSHQWPALLALGSWSGAQQFIDGVEVIVRHRHVDDVAFLEHESGVATTPTPRRLTATTRI